MKTILFVATTLAIAVSTLNNDTVPKKRVPDSIDSLLAKSKTNFVKANSSIKVAEKLQKENFENIKSKITALADGFNTTNNEVDSCKVVVK